MNILDLTIKELHAKLLAKEISAKELADFYLSRIEKFEPELKAFIKTTPDIALESAKSVDKKISTDKTINPLAGIPASIKDVIVTKDVESTGGSQILKGYVPPYNATVIENLIDQDYVLMGKTNCDEFAMGSSTENSGYFVSKNPWDKSRVPGGSSGGSAVAVAAGLSHYSLGTDTGGSVRQPASLCGVVGLKPTYGRVSRYGLMAMASSLDQLSMFGRRVDDVEEILKAVEGEDIKDGTSSQRPSKFKALDLAGNLKGIKIGVPKEYFAEGLDKEVEQVVRQAIDKLGELGVEIKEISLPNFEYALATYYIIMPAEVSSNMARYDGIRYGNSAVDGKAKFEDMADLYKENRSQFLGDEVKRRIMLGTYVLSAGYYDEFYGKAQKVRQLIKQDFAKAFADVDVIAGPVTPTPAFKLGEKTDNPLSMYLEDIYTVPANLAGVPGMSVPAGFVEKENKKLPVGLHLIGNWWEDYKLFEIARQLESALNINNIKPQL